MGQIAAKAKQVGDQAGNKTADGNKAARQHDATDLINFMGKNYDTTFKTVTSFDEFYHFFHELIQQYCEERGQIQYKMPSKKELEEQYNIVNARPKEGQNLTKEQFMKLTGQIIKVDSFTFGRAAMDVLVVLFGAPVCALFVKRIVPGLKSFSDDVIIPAATSGAVIYLAKTNKL
ncbi:hypothetical protein GUJ93_ZPchr0005g14875 [Zizania palustris]|uniref:Uncharacterized protein n=1 Tax=Zizania palustris TaxID=103762 RepID=A0A8J5W1X1_ZIZPA|nr:hypothetical protein GUJ93_ZPchr0005g14875 [Zizania palustris]